MNNIRQYIVIAIIFICILGLFYFLLKPQKQELNWNSQSLSYKDTMPYGGEIFYNQIKDFHKKNKLIKRGETLDKILDTLAERKNYFYFGNRAYQLDEELDAVLRFVENGNQAIYICNDVPQKLFDIFGITPERIVKTYNAKNEIYRFTHPSLSNISFSRSYRDQFDTVFNQFKCISNPSKNSFFKMNNNFYLKKFKEISVSLAHTESIDTATYFYKINYGKGSFYIHYNPILLSNYGITRIDGIKYSESLLAHFNNDFAYFDDASNYYKYGSQNTSKPFTPLSYILSQKSLKFAFYSLLGIVLLWLMFFTKRKQNIIPVLTKNTNTSLDYVKTIGSLYYADLSFKDIMAKELEMFFSFTKWKYKFDFIQHSDSELKRFMSRTNIKQSDIKTLISNYKSVTHLDNISVELLNQIQKKMHHIYTKNYDRK